MIRTVRQLNAIPGSRDPEVTLTISDFRSSNGVILLGDPGAGKTHAMRQAAQAEGGRYITARAFLTIPPGNLSGRALYIDALDEQRAGRTDRGIVDTIATKLFEVGPSKVWISCRVADWLGDSDIKGLNPYFEQFGQPPVLLLQALEHTDRIAVLADRHVDATAAAAFLTDAKERGLDEFLDNPQNLIMLWTAVQAGNWPSSRKELFEGATELMLQEFNDEHSRSRSGQFSVSELKPVAGAICAVRLISDVEGISLKDQEGSPDVPGYRSLKLYAPDLVLGALSRRIFDAGSEDESVDYVHRTTAEFLAAEFLASRIRVGLPIGRVRALIGVEGHPATELRGLHAWLAVHLAEYAEELVEADPYGVLVYGDAASLPRSACRSLVRALARLSSENPWFRHGTAAARSVGGLARADLLPELLSILRDPNSTTGIRSIVVDALRWGTPLMDALPDLVLAVSRQEAPYAERSSALYAMLRFGEAGEAAVHSLASRLGHTLSDLRLRADAISALYPKCFGPREVIALALASRVTKQTSMSGSLWRVVEALPEADAPEILDGIVEAVRNAAPEDRKSRNLATFFERLLLKAWPALQHFDPERGLRWLEIRLLLAGRSDHSEMAKVLRAHPERLHDMWRHFLRSVPANDEWYQPYDRFMQSVFDQIGSEMLLALCFAEMLETSGEERKQLLLQIALPLCYRASRLVSEPIFERLWQFSSGHLALQETWQKETACRLPTKYFDYRTRDETTLDDQVTRDRMLFDRDIEQIKAGVRADWLEYLANIYFALFNRVDRNAEPRDRVSDWFGAERADDAIAGLEASMYRGDLPEFSQMLDMSVERRYHGWWYALHVGLNRQLDIRGDLASVSDDLLGAMLVFDVDHPISEPVGSTEQWLVQPWRRHLMEKRPDLVQSVYLSMAAHYMAGHDPFSDAFYSLLDDEELASGRDVIILHLLDGKPDAEEHRLSRLLQAVLQTPYCQARFNSTARSVLEGAGLGQRQHDLWLATAYLLLPEEYQNEVVSRARSRPDFVFDIRDKTGHDERETPTKTLSVGVLSFLLRTVGCLHPPTPYPTGGFSGDRNAWDASDWFSHLLNTLSAYASQEATEALEQLAADDTVIAYWPNIRLALDNQRRRRRDTEYDRPTWTQTISTLENGPPATVADLYALSAAHLGDLALKIARTNTDIYKRFWNLDQHANPTEPLPEEACRDVLVDMLRTLLGPVHISVEPEGHMAADKRADISIAMPGRKILCELKRDYHPKVWKAIVEQLERFYAHDPEAKGHGIYVVFWFGEKRPQSMPSPPDGKRRPHSADEMEAMLLGSIPDAMRQRITAIVIDASGCV